MRAHSAALFGAFIAFAPILVFACKKDDAAPQPTTPAGYPSSGTYPPSGYPAAGQPTGYPQPGTAPVPMSTGGAPAAPAASGALAVPGPAALPCTNDSMCMTHKCNTQYGKCAFPCASDSDCITGAFCFKSAISTCLPKPPSQ